MKEGSSEYSISPPSPQRLKGILKAKSRELHTQVMMTGQAPSLASVLSNDPAFSPLGGAPHAAPPAVAQTTFPPQQFAAPPPMPMPQQGPTYPGMLNQPVGGQVPAGAYSQQYPPPAVAYPPPAAAPTGVKRGPEFHSVPPPKKSEMQGELPRLNII